MQQLQEIYRRYAFKITVHQESTILEYTGTIIWNRNNRRKQNLKKSLKLHWPEAAKIESREMQSPPMAVSNITKSKTMAHEVKKD